MENKESLTVAEKDVIIFNGLKNGYCRRPIKLVNLAKIQLGYEFENKASVTSQIYKRLCLLEEMEQVENYKGSGAFRLKA